MKPNYLGHIIECPDCRKEPDYYCDIDGYYQFWCKGCKATKRLLMRELRVHKIRGRKKTYQLAEYVAKETRLGEVV